MSLLQPIVSMLWQVKANKVQQGLFQANGSTKAELEAALAKLRQQNTYSRGILNSQQTAFANVIANFDEADINGDGRIDTSEWQEWQRLKGGQGVNGSTATGWQGLMERLLLNQQGGQVSSSMQTPATMASMQTAFSSGNQPMTSLNQRMQSLLDNRYTGMSSSFDF